ncbi:MAG: transporter substrate-binding domain-containing protein [Bacteroidetes bacterium]|nr:transporter substrate-binding domain-containing protein [Bacteroidota bacterium]
MIILHRIILTVLIFFFLVVPHALGFQQSKPQKVKVGVLVDNYPFSYRDSAGHVQGFAFELVQELENILSLKFD